MQGDRKTIGLFIIILGVLLIAAIIYFFFINPQFRLTEEDPNTEPTPGLVVTEGTTIPETNPGNAPINYQLYNVDQEEARATTGDDLGKLAMSIAERFGSFSNQSNYGNFTDLKILMTSDMKAWVDTYVADLRSQPKNVDNPYYGITTKAVNYEVLNFNDKAGQAEILVSTQRRESTDAINGGESFNQELRLELVKVSGDWLFDAAYWSKN